MKTRNIALAIAGGVIVLCCGIGAIGSAIEGGPTVKPTATPSRTSSASSVPTKAPTPTPTPVATATPTALQSPSDEPSASEPIISKPKVVPTTEAAEVPPVKSGAYYASCKEAKAAGAAPLYRGQPGYSGKLDRDGDGVACER